MKFRVASLFVVARGLLYPALGFIGGLIGIWTCDTAASALLVACLLAFPVAIILGFLEERLWWN